ncbi:hypothetical protein [Saccharopolyspora sp. 5N708]|uniref:hypothetical protein n=1 Tax=Saccharopolyspora sp. 5N708 TaxID=3457424 RepID=UPI003FD4BC87
MVELVTVPAVLPAGHAALEIHEHGVIVGDVDFRVCDACRLGLVEHVRVDRPRRRRGLATQAINKLLADWPDPETFGKPGECTHIREADEQMP